MLNLHIETYWICMETYWICKEEISIMYRINIQYKNKWRYLLSPWKQRHTTSGNIFSWHLYQWRILWLLGPGDDIHLPVCKLLKITWFLELIISGCQILLESRPIHAITIGNNYFVTSQVKINIFNCEFIQCSQYTEPRNVVITWKITK